MMHRPFPAIERMSPSMRGFSRRQFTATAAGFAAGVFATSRLAASAQDGTPSDESRPLGYVSTRVRTVESGEQRELVGERVLNGFVRDVQALDGYRGYLLADVIDQPEANLTVVVFENEEQHAGFVDLASEFVAGIEEDISTVDTQEWAGDLLIVGSTDHPGSGTPASNPGAGPLTTGYVAVRVHTSLEGTDPRDFVPLAQSDFLPIVVGLEGFRGYLWYPTEGGFVAISLYDSQEAAEESNEAAKDWAAEFLTEYTDGNPEIINANIRFASLPVLR